MDSDFGRAYNTIQQYLVRPSIGFFGRMGGISRSQEQMLLAISRSDLNFDISISVEENVIQIALSKLNLSLDDLRDDAHVFLLTNIKHMFVMPVRRVFFIYKKRSESEFNESMRMIIDDVTQVISYANGLRQGGPIVAAHLLQSSGVLWNNLATNQDGKFWGGRDG